MDNDYLYHVTFAGSLGGIAEHGLLPGTGHSRFGGGYGEHSAGWVFVTEPDGVFFWHSRMEQSVTPIEDVGEVPVVLRYMPTAAEEDELEEDEIGTRDARAAAYKVPGGIEAWRLEVWTGDEWQPLVDVSFEGLLDDIQGAALLEEDDGEEWWEYDADMLMPPELHP